MNTVAEPIPQPESLSPHEQAHDQIMSIFTQKLSALKQALETNPSKEKSGKLKGAVILSFWEEDGTLLTAKMLSHSLADLLQQARESGMDLDIFLIANNGGGANPKIADAANRHILDFAQNNFGQIDNITKIETEIPQGEVTGAATPWNIPLNLADLPDSPNGVRLVFVKQSANSLNKGKIRSLRDITHFLEGEILSHHYAPDFIFQMDAETILKYSKPNLANVFPPLKAMYNQLQRRNLVALGTKDRFAVMDPETGLPLNTPIGSAQKGFESTNTPDKFISLPGGALMSKPEFYLAGMSAICTVTPSMGVEDYLYTKILQEYAKQKGASFESIAKSLGIITHLNRTPKDWRQAIKQMVNWRQHALAADQIFPGDPYNTEALLVYIGLVVKARIEDAKTKGPEHLLKLIRDVQDLPYLQGIFSHKTSADIFNTSTGVEWTSSSAATGAD